MPRPNPLADPDFAKAVGEAFADGLSRQEMCDMFGVKDRDTITRWRRDSRVKAYALKIIEDRVLRVSRRVDAKIESILQEADGDLTVQELLAIRKEYVGGALRQQMEKADEDTVGEALTWLEDNPDAANQLETLLREGKLPGVAEPVEEAA